MRKQRPRATAPQAALAQPTDVGEYTHILVPSVVAFVNGQLRVGEGAKRLRARTVELGDAAKEEKYYRDASAADRRWGTPLFNL